MVLNNIICSLIGPTNFTKSGSYQDTGIFPELFNDPKLAKVYHGTVQLALIDDSAHRETFYREVTFLYRNTIVQQIPITPNAWKELPNMMFDRIEIKRGYDALKQPMSEAALGRFEFNFDGDLLSTPETMYNYVSKTSINDTLPALVSISGSFPNYGGGTIQVYNYDWIKDQRGDLVASVSNLALLTGNFIINHVPSNSGYVATINGQPTLVNGDEFFFTNSADLNLELSLVPDENFEAFELPAANDSLTENVDVQVNHAGYRQDALQVFSIDNTTGEEIFVTQAEPIAATMFGFSLAPNTAYVFRNRSVKLSVDGNAFLFTNQASMNVNVA